MKRVLLVDDDEDVRLVAAAILGELGYRVLEADCADRALEILRAEADIDLLMTDLAMPGMSGFELAHVARALRPQLPVLYTSAYVRGVEGSPALRYGPLIEKPWVLPQLQKVLVALIGPPE